MHERDPAVRGAIDLHMRDVLILLDSLDLVVFVLLIGANRHRADAFDAGTQQIRVRR